MASKCRGSRPSRSGFGSRCSVRRDGLNSDFCRIAVPSRADCQLTVAVPRSAQPSVPPGSVKDQLRLKRKGAGMVTGVDKWGPGESPPSPMAGQKEFFVKTEELSS